MEKPKKIEEPECLTKVQAVAPHALQVNPDNSRLPALASEPPNEPRTRQQPILGPNGDATQTAPGEVIAKDDAGIAAQPNQHAVSSMVVSASSSSAPGQTADNIKKTNTTLVAGKQPMVPSLSSSSVPSASSSDFVSHATPERGYTAVGAFVATIIQRAADMQPQPDATYAMGYDYSETLSAFLATVNGPHGKAAGSMYYHHSGSHQTAAAAADVDLSSPNDDAPEVLAQSPAVPVSVDVHFNTTIGADNLIAQAKAKVTATNAGSTSPKLAPDMSLLQGPTEDIDEQVHHGASHQTISPPSSGSQCNTPGCCEPADPRSGNCALHAIPSASTSIAPACTQEELSPGNNDYAGAQHETYKRPPETQAPASSVLRSKKMCHKREGAREANQVAEVTNTATLVVIEVG